MRDKYMTGEMRVRALEEESTTKNDLPHCQHTDEEIAKSFIEDVEAVKDQLPCGQQMDFPNTFDEFVKDYGFRDKQEVYTNGSELIPVFRVKQWLEHIQKPTTKNDLGVDCISRADLYNRIKGIDHDEDYECDEYGGSRITYHTCDWDEVLREIEDAPSVTPIRPKGHWIVEKGSYLGMRTACCGNCKDFYTHNWNVMNYCPNCGAKMESEE